MRGIALLLTVFAISVSAAEEPAFSALREKADHAASHGEGMRYANHAKHYLLARQEAAAKSCFESTSESSARFDMLVWVTKDGTIDKARVEPESPVSLCVATAVVGTRVRAPDVVPWVVHVEWDVTRDQ